ncbi:hypothetical protein PENSPDRAFT_686878 [Peniophora sp. CONT]|nr:hypothetical protein PENSPDRAFT_686878 [Peniophora sp. CONT]
MTSTTFSDSHPSPSPTTAFSPFSTPHSHATDFATSDESPDLGAFRNIFRTFQELQPRWPAHLAPTALVPGAPSTLLGLGTGTPPTTDRDARGLTPTDLDSSLDLDGVELHSTVWAQQPVARYLDAASPPPGSATPSSTTNSQSQGQDYSRPRNALVTHDLPTHDLPRPTLGGLDAAFEFLANERARLAAQRASLPSIRPLPLPIPITFESSLEPEPGRSSNNTTNNASNANNNASSNRRRRRRKASSLVRIGGGRVRGHDADFEDAEDSWEEPLSPLEGMGGGGGGGHRDGGSLPVTPAKRLAATADTTAAGLLAVAASQSQSKFKNQSSPLTAKDKGKDKTLDAGKNLPSGSAADYAHRLHHARSTPVLRAPTLQTRPLDPQRVRLRALAIKLKFLFPGEAGRLTRVLAQPSMGAEPEIGGVGDGGEGVEEEEDFADVRGPEPVVGEGEAITHVFVDYSNILIGYLSYLRSHRLQAAHLSHAALALVLERGRPITRRVLAASSPLYQPLEPAQKLGYEVHVYARVPDTGDGADRIRKSGVNGNGGESPRNGKAGAVESPRNGKAVAMESPRKAEPERGRKNAHRRGVSVGSGVIQESDSSASAGAAKLAPGKTAPIAIPSTANAISNSNLPSSTGSPSNARIRYREQGVDELLQLKLHQAIAAQGDSPPPPGSTIVLATGDGNAGQFNEDGFRGCVRLALRRKWRVELHAWETGTSRAWAREFGRETGFSIEKMDRFATDLIVA